MASNQHNSAKIMLALLTTGVLLQSTLPAGVSHAASPAAATSVKFQIGSRTVNDYRGNHTLGAAPYMVNNSAMVPVRAMAEGLKGTITWDASTQEIHLTRGELTVHLKVNSTSIVSTYTKNIKLPEAVVVKGGVAFVPARSVASLLGAVVSWDALGKKISIQGNQGEQAAITRQYTFQNGTGTEGWQGGFADLPVDYNPAIYELEYIREKLPVSGGAEYGLKLKGMNRSDDLFMFVTKKVEGLAPNTSYQASLSFNLYSNESGGMMGIGGAPAESVKIKAGIINTAPKAIKVEDSGTLYYRLNIDKGNQSTEGKDMKIVGNMLKPDDQLEGFQAIAMRYTKTLTTNDQGELYVIIGSDSGYEGLTTLYLDDIKLTLKP